MISASFQTAGLELSSSWKWQLLRWKCGGKGGCQPHTTSSHDCGLRCSLDPEQLYNYSKEIFENIFFNLIFSHGLMKCYLKEKWSCVKITTWLTWRTCKDCWEFMCPFPWLGHFPHINLSLHCLKIGKMGQNYLARICKPSVTCLRKREFH